MKLITWNCQGAIRKKADLILNRKPDILVIQECEHADKLKFGLTTAILTDVLWFGDNPHVGKFEDWIEHSDHLPLEIELEF
jgi:exodeoxyribonuclease III